MRELHELHRLFTPVYKLKASTRLDLVGTEVLLVLSRQSLTTETCLSYAELNVSQLP